MQTGAVLGMALCFGPLLWIAARRMNGLPALERREREGDHAIR